MAYLYLLAAIIFEVTATLCLKPNEVLNPVLQIFIIIFGYSISFLFLYIVLKSLPIGIVYATWSGIGIVLVGVLGNYFFGQKLDLPAWIGMGLIILGAFVMNFISKSTIH